MKKVKVSTGIFWVEIPESGLYILCGCPADSVKHLLQKGFITLEQKGNILCENGPNAILLSDIPIQNERFANLSEFPVLQMLYRQGMIIPGHPNNKGDKPLLIGSPDQVKAQAEYIYRGNYGLSSLEEITAAGVPRDQAEEMMRIKLRFAYGNIRKTEDLLDTIKVGDNKPVELRNGVFIRRTGVNQFEFMNDKESVAVDLNLPPRAEYESSYRLGYHEIKRDYFSIIHSGEGDGWDIHKPCMASILIFQGKIYLIDAGPNIIHSLRALGISVNEIEGIFHTHAHDDHFNGLTYLLRADHKIKYYATKLIRHSVQKKMAALLQTDDDNFSKYFDIHDMEFDKWHNIDALEVMPVYSPHPTETNIFFFRALWGDGHKTYAHLADITGIDILKKMVSKPGETDGIAQSDFNKAVETYLVPADLKKIDAGGGLIHGNADDFKNDTSDQIILSHSASEFTDVQRETSSTTSFGASDILIPSNQDYAMQSAFRNLRMYFPGLKEDQLRILLNCPTVSFNPGSILIRRGENNRSIYLVISGIIEFIMHEKNINNRLSAGSMAGEYPALTNTGARGTYRALSQVKAIQMPSGLYLNILKLNEIYESTIAYIDIRNFLQTTWLFGELLSCPAKSAIARSITIVTYKNWEDILSESDNAAIYLLAGGKINIFSKGMIIDTIDTGDFLGEEKVLFNTKTMYKAKAAGSCTIYRIPAEMIENIPIVQWKLLETYEKRKKLYLS